MSSMNLNASSNDPSASIYDFDRQIDRLPFASTKWLEMDGIFGTNDLIPMWVADMDFQVAPEILEAVQAMAQHGIFGYMNRSADYFEAIVRWYEGRYQWTLKADQLCFSPGVICTLSLLIDGLTNADDTILIQEPVYYPFKMKIIESGRQCIVNPLRVNDKNGLHYEIDFEGFEALLEEKKPKVFILCNPHNPVGRVWTKDELLKIGALCLKHEVRIIADEIHSDLVFKPHRHYSIASLSPQLAQITVTLAAPSKTFNLAGLQTSFAICTNPSDLELLNRGFQRLDIKRNNSFSLVATYAAYTKGEAWLEALLAYIKSNETYARNFLSDHLKNIRIAPLQGTYLLWVDMSPMGLTDDELQDHLVNKAGLALSRGDNFGLGGSGFVRINLACPKSQLATALEQLVNSFTMV